MNNLIWLHDWETDKDIAVDPDRIVSMRRLGAAVHPSDSADRPPQELGERTRIDTSTDLFLVRETPEEIKRLAIGRSKL